MTMTDPTPGTRAEQLTLRLADLNDEIASLEAKHGDRDSWAPGVRERVGNLQTAITTTESELTRISERAARVEAIARIAQDPANLEPATVTATDLPTRQHATPGTGSTVYDRAARTIDTAHRSGELPDHAAEAATHLITHGRLGERDLAARWATTTGTPAYRQAFVKLLADPDRGHLLWTREEQAAYGDVATLQAEMSRGMTLTDNAGGYMVPLTLDPSIILTSAGSINPMRQVARVVQTATDTWQGVSSAGVSAEWTAEAAEWADATPTLGAPAIPVHKGDAWVPYSFEIGQDAVNFTQELTRLLADAADQLQATAFVTGTGTGQPTGIVTALAGGSSVVTPTVAETFTAADVYKTLEALPPRFRARAAWQGNLSVLNLIDQMETTNGSKRFPELDNDRLLRRPVHENSNFDGTFNPAATASNYLLAVGDWSNFVIVDRIGTTVELVPHLMGDNGRPTGQRGLVMWFRTGSDSVNDNAFRLLNLPTTA